MPREGLPPALVWCIVHCWQGKGPARDPLPGGGGQPASNHLPASCLFQTRTPDSVDSFSCTQSDRFLPWRMAKCANAADIKDIKDKIDFLWNFQPFGFLQFQFFQMTFDPSPGPVPAWGVLAAGPHFAAFELDPPPSGVVQQRPGPAMCDVTRCQLPAYPPTPALPAVSIGRHTGGFSFSAGGQRGRAASGVPASGAGQRQRQ